MKSVGDIFKELGFNPDSSLSVQKSFFKHLAQQAEANQLKRETKTETQKKPEPVQLEFNFDENKRVS